jgi:hypothetical protein
LQQEASHAESEERTGGLGGGLKAAPEIGSRVEIRA